MGHELQHMDGVRCEVSTFSIYRRVVTHFMLMAPHREERYISIKALKGYSTDLIGKCIMWELETLERVTSVPPPSGIEPTHCPRLLANFVHPREDWDGAHLCLVTDVMGGDVKALQVKVAGQNTLPLPLAK